MKAREETRRYASPLAEVTLADVPKVGGKNASLGEMIRELSPLGVRVPGGFALTAAAFRLHLERAGIEKRVYGALDVLDIHDTRALAETGETLRELVRTAPLPEEVAAELRAAYSELSRAEGVEAGLSVGIDVAVRSSATAEDLPTASFAGQHETYLNIRGQTALDAAVRACMASLFTDRAIVYRTVNRFDHRSVALSVGVQRMVRSDLACAGTMFTLDTESGFRGVVLIDGAWGLGETIVQGRVNPDEFWVHKATCRAGFRPIVRRRIAEKIVKLVYADPGGAGAAGSRAVREERVPAEDRARAVLSDDEVLALTRWGMLIEEHYSKRAGHDMPMDIEWAKDGRSGDLFIVQARPETVHAQKAAPRIEMYRIQGAGKPLVSGLSVGSRIGHGPVKVVRSSADLRGFPAGGVLVASMTDPDWEPVLAQAAAVVTDQGGRTCHAAIVSRELGLPCVVGCGVATEVLREGREVTVSCAEGDVGHVYDGRVPFERHEVDPASVPVPRVPLMLNLANPERVFQLAQLPAAGVGLLRIEFLVSNWVGVHPMALVHPERVADPKERAEIRSRAAGHPSLQEFFVSRLAEGVAQIGAAFHPRRVIVRFSDFKTNEYAALLGGAGFEPKEDNPMIGFRGASRYYDERYREAFALECAAIRRVREDMGLANVIVMVPFCRTLGEGRAVLAEMEKNGLSRGKDRLEIYVMCEIPNNVVLAEEFSDLFDGFSIGSNDLTQLTLGVDRDSALLTHLFDERDPGVRKMIELVIAAAHRKGRKVGICGEAPSNYPEFATWLASVGIDSMSLEPDALLRVAKAIAQTAPVAKGGTGGTP
jgi:pyruvate,water dikinase